MTAIQFEQCRFALKGKALWRYTRAADLAAFQFGERIQVRDFHGNPAEVGRYSLHVQCAWRITQRDQILVGSRDLYYDMENSLLPPDRQGEKAVSRIDHAFRLLFENGMKQFDVVEVNFGPAATLHIGLQQDLILDVFPDDSTRHEHWRFFGQGEEDIEVVL